jgi:hypothetical protein
MDKQKKFYYIECPFPDTFDVVELYTLEDILEVVQQSRRLCPEQEFNIREFEPI